MWMGAALVLQASRESPVRLELVLNGYMALVVQKIVVAIQVKQLLVIPTWVHVSAKLDGGVLTAQNHVRLHFTETTARKRF